jgi:hypothetical protein
MILQRLRLRRNGAFASDLDADAIEDLTSGQCSSLFPLLQHEPQAASGWSASSATKLTLMDLLSGRATKQSRYQPALPTPEEARRSLEF